MLRKVRLLIFIMVKLKPGSSVDWEKVKCSADPDQTVPEGRTAIGRFPWLGVVQHAFYVAQQTRFAVTAGILIHPGYAIASAEDMARVPREDLFNKTKFILWHSEQDKFAVFVQDYLLHPEFEQGVTFSTLALLELMTYGETGISDLPSAVLPVCLPISGLGNFDKMYSVRFTDEDAEVHKEVNLMNYVTDKECEEFYFKAGLSDEKMKPRNPTCAVVESQKQACVWDAGSALIARQTWGHWMILGFGMRGAGCGAPARYVSIHDYLTWIDDVITKTNPDQMDRTVRMELRRNSPHSFTMYAADIKLPKQFGMSCNDRKSRGNVIYKDLAEVQTSKNFGQGFFFLSVTQVASVKCIQVELTVLAQSKAAVWVEHHCHRDSTAQRGFYWWGSDSPHRLRRDECFMYFKSKAFIEVRFYFSFRATLEITVFGFVETEKVMPDPFARAETTVPWWPTTSKLHAHWWHPSNTWMWHLP